MQMSTDRKLLLGAGALLLVLMSSIIAFSVGVFVGVRGWGVQPAISMQRTNQPAAQKDARPAIPQDVQPQDRAMPQERPVLTGLLVNGNRSALTIRTKDGLRQMEIDKNLVLTRWDGESIAPADLKRGMALAVFGELDEEEKALRVKRIVVLPSAEERNDTTK
jgi:hypothetical protein